MSKNTEGKASSVGNTLVRGANHLAGTLLGTGNNSDEVNSVVRIINTSNCSSLTSTSSYNYLDDELDSTQNNSKINNNVDFNDLDIINNNADDKASTISMQPLPNPSPYVAASSPRTVPASHVKSTVESIRKRIPTLKINEDEGSSATPIETASMIAIAKEEKNMFQRLGRYKYKILKRYLTSLLCIYCFMIIIFPIFWGSLHGRDHFLNRVRFLVLIEDDNLVSSDNYPFMKTDNMKLTTHVMDFLHKSHKAKYQTYNTSSYIKKFKLEKSENWDNLTEVINEDVINQIHRERFWGALYIRPNVTQNLINSFLPENQKNNTFNFAENFQIWYESSRGPTGVQSVIVPVFTRAEAYFQAYYTDTYLPNLFHNISLSNSQTKILDNLNYTIYAENSFAGFSNNDYRPFPGLQVFIPLAIGIVFALLMTVFQMVLHSGLYKNIRKYLTFKEYILFRIVSQWGTLFFVSIMWAAVAAMVQVNFKKAFGDGGFVVYWMTIYLTMLAMAGANENVLSVILTFEERLMMPWVITFIIINISTSFFDFALNSPFYRLGYALPMHNCVTIFKVVMFNASKHKMGRNYGVLIAWIALNYTLFPFVIKLCDWKKNRNNIKAKAKADASHSKKDKPPITQHIVTTHIVKKEGHEETTHQVLSRSNSN